MILPIIIIIIAIIVAISYTLIIYKKRKSELWSWWHTFISIVVSVTLAWSTGYLLFEYQNEKIDESRKEQLVNLIDVETKYIISILDGLRGTKYVIENRPDSLPDTSVYVKHYQIQPIALDESVKSGLFLNTVSFLMLTISIELKQYKDAINTIYLARINYKQTDYFANNILSLARGIERQRKLIIEHTKTLRDLLNLEEVKKDDQGRISVENNKSSS